MFVIFILAALAWTFVKSSEPGGGSIAWFLGFLLMALVNYYYGFVEVGTNPFRSYAQAGFFTFLMLTFLAAYLARLEDNGLVEISEYAVPYPNVESVHIIPRASDKTIQHWQIETSDPIERIAAFYSDPENRRDWQVILDKPMLVLQKDALQLTIIFAQQPRSDKTSVFYHLERR